MEYCLVRVTLPNHPRDGRNSLVLARQPGRPDMTPVEPGNPPTVRRSGRRPRPPTGQRTRTAIAQAIKAGTDPGLVRQAIAAARGRGLIGETTQARLLVALDERERTGKVALAI